MDMKLEVVVVPVSDVDRAKDFYQGLGWRLDADFAKGDGLPGGAADPARLGSARSSSAPGSPRPHRVRRTDCSWSVTDIEAARAELVSRGAEVSEVFHDAGGVFHHAGTEGRVAGPAPDHQSYGSFVSFSDPDGNSWFVQEITTRLPGR